MSDPGIMAINQNASQALLRAVPVLANDTATTWFARAGNTIKGNPPLTKELAKLGITLKAHLARTSNDLNPKGLISSASSIFPFTTSNANAKQADALNQQSNEIGRLVRSLDGGANETSADADNFKLPTRDSMTFGNLISDDNIRRDEINKVLSDNKIRPLARRYVHFNNFNIIPNLAIELAEIIPRNWNPDFVTTYDDNFIWNEVIENELYIDVLSYPISVNVNSEIVGYVNKDNKFIWQLGSMFEDNYDLINDEFGGLFIGALYNGFKFHEDAEHNLIHLSNIIISCLLSRKFSPKAQQQVQCAPVERTEQSILTNLKLLNVSGEYTVLITTIFARCTQGGKPDLTKRFVKPNVYAQTNLTGAEATAHNDLIAKWGGDENKKNEMDAIKKSRGQLSPLLYATWVKRLDAENWKDLIGTPLAAEIIDTYLYESGQVGATYDEILKQLIKSTRGLINVHNTLDVTITNYAGLLLNDGDFYNNVIYVLNKPILAAVTATLRSVNARMLVGQSRYTLYNGISGHFDDGKNGTEVLSISFYQYLTKCDDIDIQKINVVGHFLAALMPHVSLIGISKPFIKAKGGVNEIVMQEYITALKSRYSKSKSGERNKNMKKIDAQFKKFMDLDDEQRVDLRQRAAKTTAAVLVQVTTWKSDEALQKLSNYAPQLGLGVVENGELDDDVEDERKAKSKSRNKRNK